MRVVQVREWYYKDEPCFLPRLKRWHIALDTLQVLEVVVRQALLDPAITGYSFAFDHRDANLSLKDLTVEEYIRKILAYIEFYEGKKKTRFEAIQKMFDLTPQPNGQTELTDEYLKLEELAGVYIRDPDLQLGAAWLEQLQLAYDGWFHFPENPLQYGLERYYFKRGHDDVFTVYNDNNPKEVKVVTDKQEIAAIMADVEAGRAFIKPKIKLKDKLKINRPLWGYLTKTDDKSVLKLTKHEFFSYYGAVAKTICLPVFENLSIIDPDDEELTGESSHRFYGFLSEKFRYAFGDDPTFRAHGEDLDKLLSADILSDRIRKSDFANGIEQKIWDLGLIDERFFSLLAEHNGKLSKI